MTTSAWTWCSFGTLGSWPTFGSGQRWNFSSSLVWKSAIRWDISFCSAYKIFMIASSTKMLTLLKLSKFALEISWIHRLAKRTFALALRVWKGMLFIDFILLLDILEMTFIGSLIFFQKSRQLVYLVIIFIHIFIIITLFLIGEQILR